MPDGSHTAHTWEEPASGPVFMLLLIGWLHFSYYWKGSGTGGDSIKLNILGYAPLHEEEQEPGLPWISMA